jgi:hypothetical protein
MNYENRANKIIKLTLHRLNPGKNSFIREEKAADSSRISLQLLEWQSSKSPSNKFASFEKAIRLSKSRCKKKKKKKLQHV